MFKIIPPDQFKCFPWKNGGGQTTQLAISEGGTVSDFEWRISIASVVEDGPFSDFTNFERHLVLIEGNGLELQHDRRTSHYLGNILDVASFDGGSKTLATLESGPIKDFNLMILKGKFKVMINTHPGKISVRPQPADLGFMFCLESVAEMTSVTEHLAVSLPAFHLLQLDQLSPPDLTIDGERMIEIGLTKL